MSAPHITACTMDCPDSCSLLIDRDREGLPRIRGNPDHPFTRGFTCKKIKNHLKRLNHSGRVLYPLLKKQGAWKRVSWDQAFDLCAEKIQALRHEPSSILHIPGEGAKGVLKKGVGLFFSKLGTSRVKGSLCDAAGYLAYVKDFGSRENPHPENLRKARWIVNWGKDLSRSSIHMGALVQSARKAGAEVLCVSPGGDGNAPFSDRAIRIRPGTDRFLAAAVVRRFLAKDVVPAEVIKRTRDWQAFKRCLLAWSEDDLLSRCGVAREEAEELFNRYAGEGPTATIVGTGVQRYVRGGENVRFINALAVVSGNMDREGGGSFYHLHSFANLNLTWARVPDGQPRRSLLLPRIGRDILGAKGPGIKMIWAHGGNIINQAPDIHRTIRAFEAVPFKVVVDAFMTDTAERADLVLPATLMLEQQDIVGSFLHSFVHWVPEVFPPPGEARDDYSIVRQLGKRLDPPVLLPSTDACFQACLESPHLVTSLEELRRSGFSQARRPSYPYADLRFAHSDGLYHPPDILHDEPEPPAEYPFRLLTLIRRGAVHSQILPEEQETRPRAWVAPESLRAAGLTPDGEARLISPRDEIRVLVRPLEGLVPGVVLCRRGGWLKFGTGLNRLIRDEVTDLGNGAPYYEEYVRLEKIEEDQHIVRRNGNPRRALEHL